MYNAHKHLKEKKVKRLIIITFIFSSLSILHAQDVASLAKELNLYGGSKATVQWERIFSSERHLLRYKLDSLPKQTRDQLKKYLVQHSADSQQPIVPGL